MSADCCSSRFLDLQLGCEFMALVLALLARLPKWPSVSRVMIESFFPRVQEQQQPCCSQMLLDRACHTKASSTCTERGPQETHSSMRAFTLLAPWTLRAKYSIGLRILPIVRGSSITWARLHQKPRRNLHDEGVVGARAEASGSSHLSACNAQGSSKSVWLREWCHIKKEYNAL